MGDIYSYSYSIPYLFFIIILFILAYFEDKSQCIKQKNNYIYIAEILLILFFGLRGFVQSDFQNYYPWFEYLPTLWEINDFESAFEENYEPGFVLLSIMCKSISSNYFVWIFIFSLIDIILLKKIFNQYSVNCCLSFAIYFAIGALIMEFNLMRNIKAILILVYAIKYIRYKQMWKFFLCVIIATLFHITAIIFVPLYFVLDKKWPKSVLLMIFIVCVTVLISQVKLLSIVLPKITTFLGGVYIKKAELYDVSGMLDVSYGISFGFIERSVTFFMVYLFYDKWVDKTGNRYIFPNMIVIYFMCFSLLAEMSVLLERFAYYFALSYSIFYPNLVKHIRTKFSRVVLVYFIVGIFTLKIVQQTQTIVFKYDNILFGIESYEKRLGTFNFFLANID